MITVHTLMVITIIISSFYLNWKSTYNFLECYDGVNHIWKINRTFGQTFETLHVLLVIVEALMAERILYSVPSYMGYFKTAKRGDKY